MQSSVGQLFTLTCDLHCKAIAADKNTKGSTGSGRDKFDEFVPIAIATIISSECPGDGQTSIRI